MATSPREQAAIDLKIARADAIHAYATLENRLCSLLAKLLNTSNDLASLVFYRITGTRFRNGIIEDLLARRFEDKYDAYWHGVPGTNRTQKRPGLFAIIRQADELRNAIVHWTIAVNIGGGSATESLVPPNDVWAPKESGRVVTVPDLREFIRRCDFAARSVGMFTYSVFEARPDFSAADTWREILQQPCTYPPSSTHPLAPKS